MFLKIALSKIKFSQKTEVLIGDYIKTVLDSKLPIHPQGKPRGNLG